MMIRLKEAIDFWKVRSEARNADTVLLDIYLTRWDCFPLFEKNLLAFEHPAKRLRKRRRRKWIPISEGQLANSHSRGERRLFICISQERESSTSAPLKLTLSHYFIFTPKEKSQSQAWKPISDISSHIKKRRRNHRTSLFSYLAPQLSKQPQRHPSSLFSRKAKRTLCYRYGRWTVRVHLISSVRSDTIPTQRNEFPS